MAHLLGGGASFPSGLIGYLDGTSGPPPEPEAPVLVLLAMCSFFPFETVKTGQTKGRNGVLSLKIGACRVVSHLDRLCLDLWTSGVGFYGRGLCAPTWVPSEPMQTGTHTLHRTPVGGLRSHKSYPQRSSWHAPPFLGTDSNLR